MQEVPETPAAYATRFKPLARIISSATWMVAIRLVRLSVFQTACANYFLCNLKCRPKSRPRPKRFKPLARIISSATCHGVHQWNLWERVSNRLRELFPLQRGRRRLLGRERVVSNRLRELFPLQPDYHSFPYVGQLFQTACANYFLCNVSDDTNMLTWPVGFKPLARIISSATHNGSNFACPRNVSNRLRELFPLQRGNGNATSRRSGFQTACANYFLCNFPITKEAQMEVCVSNRLRELFPLQLLSQLHSSDRVSSFQTACANYFLCNFERRGFTRRKVRVSNRLRELFPLQLVRLREFRFKSRSFKPLARIISSATPASRG